MTKAVLLKCAVLPQRGAALLGALLTVALVAVLASHAFLQGWRGVEQESLARVRLQGDWVMTGALQWARVQLRDDGLADARRGVAVDHAGEPWAQAASELTLSAFLAGASTAPDSSATMSEPNAVVSLQLSDAQGKLNALNLLEGEAVSAVWLRVFERLFEQLNLPPEQLVLLTQQLRTAQAAVGGGPLSGAAALMPQQAAQLGWLGLAPATLDTLQAHVTWLPSRTPVNLNSASAEVLMAVVPGWERADANRLLAQRQAKPLQTVAEAGVGALPDEGLYSVHSRFFEFQASFSLGTVQRLENALLQRDASDVRGLWRRAGLPLDLPSVPR